MMCLDFKTFWDQDRSDKHASGRDWPGLRLKGLDMTVKRTIEVRALLARSYSIPGGVSSKRRSGSNVSVSHFVRPGKGSDLDSPNSESKGQDFDIRRQTKSGWHRWVRLDELVS